MLPTDSIPNAPLLLTAAEARVLGALIEKGITTPDSYPLSLNALVHACNQRSSRDPVMELDKEAVRQALHGLEDLRLAGRMRQTSGLVIKFEHWMGEAFNFNRAETALVCALLLRGPQTPGELRGRTERLHRFDEIVDVLAGLQKLMERKPPLVAVLARQPGTKESRYAHLFSGPVEGSVATSVAVPASLTAPVAAPVAASVGASDANSDAAEQAAATDSLTPHEAGPSLPQAVSAAPAQDQRIAQLEATVAALQHEMAALRQRIDDLFAD